MLKQGAFISKRFNKLLMGSIWGSLAYAVNLMTDSLVSGNQLGEVALQAVSIVYPLFSVVYFFAYLMPLGASVLFGKAIGEFKQEEAYRAAGTGVISSVIISILLAGGLWCVKIPFLTYFECTGELLEDASTYYDWMILFAFIEPIEAIGYYLVIADGEALLLSVANTTNITVNVILSVVLSNIYGIAGLGMATCIGEVLFLTGVLSHLLKKSNNIKFRFCLDLKIVGRSIVLSFSEYMYYLFLAIVDIVLNKIIMSSCGVEYIPAYSVVNLVFSVCEIFNSINVASMGLVTCFLGERNNHDLHFIFRKIVYATVVMAVCVTAFFFFGAPLMPIIYGLETPVTVNAAVFASRIMSFAVLGFGVCYLSTSFSSYLEKPGQACFISFLNDVFAPLLLSLVFGSLWGFSGIAIGMCLSGYFAFGLYAIVRIPKRGTAGFPVYVEDYGEDGFSWDLRVTSDSLTELRDEVSKVLANHDYEIENIDLLLEEFFTRVMEKNPGKTVTAECTLLFSVNRVRIIVRDDGVLFNFIDENNRVESLNAYVLNSLLEKTKKKNYVLTTSFNRNGFVFEK